MNFISNKGFFEKNAIFEKSSQSGQKMPFIGIFLGIFLVTYAALNLKKKQFYQVEMAEKPPNFF